MYNTSQPVILMYQAQHHHHQPAPPLHHHLLHPIATSMNGLGGPGSFEDNNTINPNALNATGMCERFSFSRPNFRFTFFPFPPIPTRATSPR